MNEIETHVLDMIGEDSDDPDVFTDDETGLAQIRESVNDAIEEIAMVTGSTVDTYMLPLTARAGFYRLEFSAYKSRLAWITGVWNAAQNRRLEQTSLIKLTAANPRWMFNTGSPEAYFPIGFTHIGLWPVPAASSGLLHIEAATVPVRYTLDTDRIKLRRDFEWAAAHFAVGEYWASRGDAKTAIRHHEKYLEKIGMYVMYPLTAEDTRTLQTAKDPWPKVTG